MTCFGYLGYKNARFGRIEAHEAVTAGGREALLRAKEAAEDMGFTVLHMYVDGLWVKKEGARQPDDFQPLLDEIADRTGLSIALDGVYRWVAFLPSRRDSRVPVANRYFGVFQDGSLKVRGVEARRRDTTRFVADTQLEMIRCLGKISAPEEVTRQVSEAVGVLRRRLRELRGGQVPLDQLLVGQKLSRRLEAYTIALAGGARGPAAAGAGQDARAGPAGLLLMAARPARRACLGPAPAAALRPPGPGPLYRAGPARGRSASCSRSG